MKENQLSRKTKYIKINARELGKRARSQEANKHPCEPTNG